MHTNVRKLILYTHRIPTCFGQSCDHHQGYKMRKADTLWLVR